MERKRAKKKFNGTRRKEKKGGSKRGEDIGCTATSMAVPIFTKERVVWNGKFRIKEIGRKPGFRNANDMRRVSRTIKENEII